MDIVVYRRWREGPYTKPFFTAMCRGFRHIGVPFEQRMEREYRPCEIAVVFGQYKKNMHKKTKWCREIYRRHPHPRLLVMEMGYLKRQHFHSLGIGGVNGSAYFPVPENYDSHRFDALKIDLKDWHKGSYILLTGQVPNDSTVHHIDYNQWVIDIIKEIRKHTDRPIHWRKHPLQRVRDTKLTVKFKKQYRVYNSSGTLEEALKKAHACVTFCSNSSVDAIIAGTPIFTFDKNAMTWDCSNHDLSDIEDPIIFEREKFLHRLAYCQWSFDEIKRGLFWKQFEDHWNATRKN